jgi:hypothetical protein
LEEAVKPTLEQPVQRFEHYQLVTGEHGTPVELGRGGSALFFDRTDSFINGRKHLVSFRGDPKVLVWSVSQS